METRRQNRRPPGQKPPRGNNHPGRQGKRGAAHSGSRDKGTRIENGPILELVIDHVGGYGDGVADWDGRQVFVPHTAPGDLVRARPVAEHGDRLTADAIELLQHGPGRAEPPCPHFGPCGGCTLQHLSDPVYDAWKHEQVATALGRQSLDPAVVDSVIRTPPATRRRAVLSVRRLRSGVVAGFYERGSARIVDLKSCSILHPDLAALVDPLRIMAADLLDGVGDEASLAMTRLDDGVEIVIGRPGNPTLADRERLAAFAEAHDLARLGWRKSEKSGGGQAEDGEVEPLAHRREGIVTLGGVPVRAPGHAFLQASVEGQDILTSRVCRAVGEADSVIDLFCGIGTFTFPLAVGRAGMKLRAFDSEPSAIAALDAAARRSGLAVRIGAAVRNLNRDPVAGDELRGVEAVVLDPPRAGARAQAEALASSGVARIAYVSCNPSSFARDARTLVDGGYVLRTVTPVDQFVWSPHLELVGVFERG
ncbi:23S rRNA (uracil(1939)-C(5))-methyltransferase RlmD [Fodinicurvata sp. EGI_FJ10296]|uniref:23S rRNA (uracil(1939)-C(5))-methyltransferase RlmD n=1 Tax=Fodinicurvata sp. EGI_FJ10296 TaxID=3231908 RepID=UPI00345585CA